MALPSPSLLLKQNGGQESEHLIFHARHAWSTLHSTTIRQPWELTMPAMHKDVLDPFRKRLKISGNLGPSSSSDVSCKSEEAASHFSDEPLYNQVHRW